MTASLSTIAVKDGAGASVVGGVLALDRSGTGSGPWAFGHVLLDGDGTNRASVDNTGALKVTVANATISIDSELAAAAAASDAASNPTAPFIQSALSLYNSSSWDRARTVINGLNTSGTGVLAAGAVGQFDDVSPGAMTENQFGPFRMSSRREQYVQLRDAAGNERGLNVDANGSIGVTHGVGSVGVAKAEDVASANGDLGVPAMVVRASSPSASSGSDGDWEFLQSEAGRLWIKGGVSTSLTDAPDATLSTGSATAIQSATSGTIRVTIASLLSNTAEIRIGSSSVTASRGAPLQPGESITLQTTANIYGFCATASQKVTVTVESD